MQSGGDTLVADAAKDLDLTLTDIPDSTLALDWRHLCAEMAADLSGRPETALPALDSMRKRILRTGNARMFSIAAPATEQALAAPIQRLVQKLEKAPATKANYDSAPV